MDEQTDSWVPLLTTGMALTVVGTVLSDATAWYVQYSVLGLALLLLTLAASRAVSSSASD